MKELVRITIIEMKENIIKSPQKKGKKIRAVILRIILINYITTNISSFYHLTSYLFLLV